MLFLEYWKRKEVTLAYQWDVMGFEEEEVLCIRLNKLSHIAEFMLYGDVFGNLCQVLIFKDEISRKSKIEYS